MAHIVEFAVTGLAGRQGLYAQKLNRDVNVFFGLNGSGKTSLLKILHYAMRDDATLLHWVPFEAAEVKIFSIQLNGIVTRSVQQTLSADVERDQLSLVSEQEVLEAARSGTVSTETEPVWRTEPQLPPDFKGRFIHGYLPTSRLFSGVQAAYSEWQRSLARGELPSEEQLDTYFARSVESLWVKYSADILSAVRHAQADGLANVLNAVLAPSAPERSDQELDPSNAYQRVEAFLRRQGSTGILGTPEAFESRYRADAKLRTVVSDINRVEQQIEEAMEPRTKLQRLIEALFSGNKRVTFGDRAVDVQTLAQKRIGLATLSSGEKQILRILIETLLAGVHTLMIDEPEISMHVDWQRQLVSSMQQLNPAAQLILATHSPEVMADIDDGKIFKL